MILALSGSAIAIDDKKPALTADEIIGKHLAAIGGKEALAKLKTRVAIGTVRKEDEREAQIAIMSERPNRVSAIYVFEKYKWQLTYDGDKTIFRPVLGHETSVVSGKYQEMASSGLMFNDISLYNLLTAGEANGAKFEAKGMKKVHGHQAYVVEIKRSKGETLRAYFDENFMWIRTDFGRVTITKPLGGFTNDNVSRAEDETDVEFYFETSDFRDVDGVKLPFKFEQVVTYPIIRLSKVGTITGTITEYRHNITIDPQMFK
jgi:hypothetical protein